MWRFLNDLNLPIPSNPLGYLEGMLSHFDWIVSHIFPDHFLPYPRQKYSSSSNIIVPTARQCETMSSDDWIDLFVNSSLSENPESHRDDTFCLDPNVQHTLITENYSAQFCEELHPECPTVSSTEPDTCDHPVVVLSHVQNTEGPTVRSTEYDMRCSTTEKHLVIEHVMCSFEPAVGCPFSKKQPLVDNTVCLLESDVGCLISDNVTNCSNSCNLLQRNSFALLIYLENSEPGKLDWAINETCLMQEGVVGTNSETDGVFPENLGSMTNYTGNEIFEHKIDCDVAIAEKTYHAMLEPRLIGKAATDQDLPATLNGMDGDVSIQQHVECLAISRLGRMSVNVKEHNALFCEGLNACDINRVLVVDEAPANCDGIAVKFVAGIQHVGDNLVSHREAVTPLAVDFANSFDASGTPTVLVHAMSQVCGTIKEGVSVANEYDIVDTPKVKVLLDEGVEVEIFFIQKAGLGEVLGLLDLEIPALEMLFPSQVQRIAPRRRTQG